MLGAAQASSIQPNNANIGGGNRDIVKPINADLGGWPLRIIAVHARRRPSGRRSAWMPAIAPGGDDRPTAFAGLNVLIQYGPISARAPIRPGPARQAPRRSRSSMSSTRCSGRSQPALGRRRPVAATPRADRRAVGRGPRPPKPSAKPREATPKPSKKP